MPWSRHVMKRKAECSASMCAAEPCRSAMFSTMPWCARRLANRHAKILRGARPEVLAFSNRCEGRLRQDRPSVADPDGPHAGEVSVDVIDRALAAIAGAVGRNRIVAI